jgi:hypothetical protein
MKEVRDKLHKQIAANVLAQVPLSSNLNFGNTTPKQKEVRTKAKVQMLGRRCVATRVQQPIVVGEHELLIEMQQQPKE